MEPDSPQILYLNTAAGDRIQAMTLAGIRRYAGALGWEVRSVPWQESRPEDIAPLLGAHRPVAGCVVECSDGNSHLPPRLFRHIPVVYLHAAPSLHGGRIARVSADNEAVARAAFRELSAGRPAAYAVVGACWDVEWAGKRIDAFSALCGEAGMSCHTFPFREEPEIERMERLARFVEELPQKTAIFAVNDRIATEVVAAAKASRRDIPRELTLLGVDNDLTVCETSEPAISSIQLDHERAGYVAARMIGNKTSHRDTETRSRNANLRVSVAPCDPKTFFIAPLLAVRRRSTGGAGRREKFVLEAVEMIRREACDGLTAMTLARRFRCSRRLFNLRFREATGHSVLDEIQYVRLEKVFALLSGTDTAIGAIADFCGFGSGVELRRVFRARMGKSLREWRKENSHT